MLGIVDNGAPCAAKIVPLALSRHVRLAPERPAAACLLVWGPWLGKQ